MSKNNSIVTPEKYLLICLAEECAEISEQCSRLAIRVSKALRFGLEETQQGQFYDNAYRISLELADLLAIAEVLEDRRVITRSDIQAKKAKLEHFLSYSVDRGACEQPGV